jgi:hypothetical protein
LHKQKMARGAFGFEDIKAGDTVKVSMMKAMAYSSGGIACRTTPPTPPNYVARFPTASLRRRSEICIHRQNNGHSMTEDDSITLQLPDGLTRTIRVSKAVNLADVSISDNVSVQSTAATVILLRKPIESMVVMEGNTVEFGPRHHTC